VNLTPSHEANLEDRLLICDCDGVLIDSEAVAARMLVTELQALWPGVDVEPVVMPLLGLRIEAVLASAADTVNRTLTRSPKKRYAQADEVLAELNMLRDLMKAAAFDMDTMTTRDNSAICAVPSRSERSSTCPPA